ncbi:hypothetical protein [Muribaculum intestinale]|uniref:hypothetical protein n=1 Tax=Muribaculum intestinale TaxID=1796646 RepID=UPI002632A694|nr:hypothetical protein [Muribaculum intestinale]
MKYNRKRYSSLIKSLLLIFIFVSCSSTNNIDNLRYALSHRELPQSKKDINIREIRKTLRQTMSMKTDTLPTKEWKEIFPFLMMLANLGWSGSGFILEAIGEEITTQSKAHVESAFYWTLKYKKELTRERIYKYMRLEHEFITHKYDMDDFESYQKWVDSMIFIEFHNIRIN